MPKRIYFVTLIKTFWLIFRQLRQFDVVFENNLGRRVLNYKIKRTNHWVLCLTLFNNVTLSMSIWSTTRWGLAWNKYKIWAQNRKEHILNIQHNHREFFYQWHCTNYREINKNNNNNAYIFKIRSFFFVFNHARNLKRVL